LHNLFFCDENLQLFNGAPHISFERNSY